MAEERLLAECQIHCVISFYLGSIYKVVGSAKWFYLRICTQPDGYTDLIFILTFEKLFAALFGCLTTSNRFSNGRH